jgi:hypothetical protein
LPFIRLYPASHFCHGLHVSDDDGADIATETNGANRFAEQFKLHNTPNFELTLFTALHVPVNGSSVHKLFEHVFHVGVPTILLLLFVLFVSQVFNLEVTFP